MSLVMPSVCRVCGRVIVRSEDRAQRGRCIDCAVEAMATYDRDMAHGKHPDAYLSDLFGARGGRPPKHRRKV